MSITAAELICYGSASRPTDDVSTSGGAIDATMRPVFTQFGAAAKLSLTSDGADTRSITIVGRLAAGDLVSETVAMTGATEVLSVNTYERILSVTSATTDAARTITLKQGTGGSVIATVPPNEKGVCAMFQGSASSPSGATTRYEKLFWKNTDATITLTGSQVTLTADPATKMNIGLASALNDSASVVNRTTAPAGVTFVGLSTAQNVPNSQNLSAGSAIGVWIKEALAQNDAAQKNTFTTQLNGNTT